MYSFRTNVVYILFFAVNVVVIRKFWTSLKRALMSNIAVVSVFMICMIVLTALFVTFWAFMLEGFIRDFMKDTYGVSAYNFSPLYDNFKEKAKEFVKDPLDGWTDCIKM